MKLDFFFWNSFFSWLVSLILSVFFHTLFLSFLHLSFCFFKRELNLRVFEWMRRCCSWKISFFKNEITADIQILVVVNSSFSFRWALLRSLNSIKVGSTLKSLMNEQARWGFWDFPPPYSQIFSLLIYLGLLLYKGLQSNGGHLLLQGVAYSWRDLHGVLYWNHRTS